MITRALTGALALLLLVAPAAALHCDACIAAPCPTEEMETTVAATGHGEHVGAPAAPAVAGHCGEATTESVASQRDTPTSEQVTLSSAMGAMASADCCVFGTPPTPRQTSGQTSSYGTAMAADATATVAMRLAPDQGTSGEQHPPPPTPPRAALYTLHAALLI